jgi:ABC-type sugar transport system substrate-binding protein
MQIGRFTGAGAVVAALAFATAGCGGGGGSTGSGGGAVSASIKQDVLRAEQAVSAWPGPASSPRPARGKRIVVVTCSSQGIGCVRAAAGAASAGKALGWAVQTIDGQGQPAVWNNAILSAITTHADGIVLDAVPPQLVGDALQRASQAHIPIVSVYNPKPSATGVPVFAYVTPDHTQQGRLMADWVAMDSHGSARVIVVEDNEFPELVQRVHGFRQELAAVCGGCKIAGTVTSTIGAMAQQLPAAVTSALQRDPTASYVIAPFDSNATFVAQGVQQAGRTGSVKVAGYEGDPQAISAVRSGQVQAATIADPSEWMGWQAIGEFVRAFAGAHPADTPVDFRLLVKANAPSTQGWLGDLNYQSRYMQLWGVS